jgi:hypothetical protein
MTMMEPLTTILVLGIVSSFGLQAIITFTNAQTTATSMPSVQEDAVRLVTMVADEIKEAPVCTALTGCQYKSALDSASNTSVVVYRDVNGTAKRTFRLQNGTFERLDNGTMNLQIPNVTTFTINYYVNSTGSYNNSAGMNSWGTAVSTADLKNVCGCRITATVTRNGIAGTYTTDFRLRNSPAK